MCRQQFIGVFGLAIGIGLAGGMAHARSQIIDKSKYPEVAGMGQKQSLSMGTAGRETSADA